MRIWLDPQKLKLSADARRRHRRHPEPEHGSRGGRDRRHAAAAKDNAQRDRHGAVATQTPAQFKNIIVKARLPARVSCLPMSPGSSSVPRITHRRSAPTAIRRRHRHLARAGANALAARPTWSRQRSAEIAPRMPPGFSYAYAIDTTVHQALDREVVKTLFEAIVLVVLVMFIFLQSWRATLIPVDRCSGRAARHVRRALRPRLLDQHADDVRAGACDRPPGRRCDRRRRERRAPDGEDPKLSPREATIASMEQITGRSSALRWCFLPCSCRWCSSAVPPASFIASFPRPSFRQWRCRSLSP